jgi:hypothetical protein
MCLNDKKGKRNIIAENATSSMGDAPYECIPVFE